MRGGELHPTRRAREGLVALVLLVAPTVVLAAYLALRDRVPEPVPTHWGPSGRVDDVSALVPYTVVIAVVTGVTALIGVALLMALRERPGRVGLVALAGGTAWLFASAYAGTLVVADGAARAEDVGVSVLMVVTIVVVPALVALLLAVLTPGPSVGSGDLTPPPSALRLDPGERISWVGRASSRRLLVVGAVLLAAAGGSVVVFWPATPGLAAVGLALIWTHTLTVRVDRSAVTVAWGPARWPRTVVPLRDVAAAESREIDPMAWGGWGYRVLPGSRAAAVRRGPGLVLTRREAVPLAITVDDADRAADLVNALVGRPGPPPED